MSDSDNNIGDPNSYAGGADTGGLGKSYSATDYAAGEITPEMAAEFAPPDDVEQAISVRPHRDNGGIEAMIEVLESLHTVETTKKGLRRRTVNVSPAHAAEIRYTADENGERSLSLQYVPGNQSLAGTFEGQLQTRYDESLFDRTDPALLPVEQATATEPDESGAADGESVYISGATLALRKYTLFPIKNISLPGFRSDPTGAIMQEMVDSQDDVAPDADVVVQIMFRPENRGWRQGVSGGHGLTDEDDPNITGELSLQELSFNLRQPTIKKERMLFTKERVEYPASKVDKKIADLLEEQQGEKGWHLCLRVFALSKDPEVAKRRASKTTGMFENFYEANSEQTFVPQPISQRDLTDEYANAVAREFEETGIVKAQGEVAGLVNIPEAQDIATNKMRWSLAKPGDGVPPKTARFPFDDYGVVSASDHLKQTTIFDTSSPGDPFYFGWGAKHGTEAGIFSKFLDAHMFIAGRTRYGKTVLTEHFCSQVFERDQGALVIDPKGRDADDFIREWPEHRDEDDLIVMDLGLNPDDEPYEKVPRFNFMEIPPGYDPDSRFAATMIEALADDIAAMVAQSGGSEKYLGALMKRVTKTVSRGLLRSGRGVSLLDLACACSSQTGLSEFSRWMDDERITFIRETAKRFEEKEDADLEPLAGRMDEWIHNDAIRDLISARDPSFSIHEAVEEGKVIVLRFAKGAGETERRLLTTALIRRTYASKRVCDNESPFYLVCDEFDKIATEESNLHTILSEAGGHNYRCVMACQAPGNQLPGRLKNAVGNQCDTFLSFNPGTKNADYVAEHHSVDAETLREMPRYKCYLRTHTSTDDNTHSYLVNAFEPIQEVRESATGETGMSDEEVEEMKLRSMERYGEEIESAQEQQEQSDFYTAGTPSTNGIGDAIEADELDVSIESVRNRALKGVDDEAIRQGNPGGYVRIDHCLARLRRYLPNGESLSNTGQLFREVVQKISDEYITHRTVESNDGTEVTELKALDTGYMNLGESQTAGNRLHWEQMADAYVPMTQLGFVFDILGQDEGMADHADETMPDALAKLDDSLHLDGIDGPGAIAERVNSYRENHPILDRLAGTEDAYVESEHTTGDSQPSQTIRNLASAHNNGHRCLFLTRPESAEHLHGVVAGDEPCCRDDHTTDGEKRFYTLAKSGGWSIDGQKITRPGASENVWVHDEESGQYVLRDTNGTVHARFNTAAEIYEDASAYPAGGDRNVMPPIIPAYEFNGGDPTEADWDIISVPKPESDEDGNKRSLTPNDLELYHEGENETLMEVALRLKNNSGDGGTDSDGATASPPSTAAAESNGDAGKPASSGDNEERDTESDVPVGEEIANLF